MIGTPLAVALGTALGGALRFLCGEAAVTLLGLAPLWSTAFVNITGSFLIGVFAVTTMEGGRWPLGLPAQVFLTVGFCGGFTTFSVLSLETLQLFLAGRMAAAVSNIALSLALCLLAVWLGTLSGERLNRAAR